MGTKSYIEVSTLGYPSLRLTVKSTRQALGANARAEEVRDVSVDGRKEQIAYAP